jgi:hypothetical protein
MNTIFGIFALLLLFGACGLAVILWEPFNARFIADLVERNAAAIVSILRAHAEAREASRLTYKRVYRFCRAK